MTKTRKRKVKRWPGNRQAERSLERNPPATDPEPTEGMWKTLRILRGLPPEEDQNAE